MGTDTYPRQDVRALLGSFVSVKVFLNRTDFDKSLAKSWNVEANPCFLVFDPAGNELLRFTGKPDPAQFVTKVTDPVLSAMREADKKADRAALADKATLLADFFPRVAAGQEAAKLLEDRKADKALGEACATVRAGRKRSLAYKQAGLLMQRNRMTEYEAALKKIVAEWPGTREAGLATEDLKQFETTPR
ncbi:MAG: hypothetical protein FD180_1519 [Planctomycetota bacterium]|nr:MAG: hypothetical protein FD180_1519 [Planctomycetota bacterium]